MNKEFDKAFEYFDKGFESADEGFKSIGKNYDHRGFERSAPLRHTLVLKPKNWGVRLKTILALLFCGKITVTTNKKLQ